MKKNLIIIFFVSASVFAQSAGNSGLAFLKLGFGARNIAMGDLGVVAVNDLTALNYNPSQLSLINKTQLSFTHNSLFQDMNSEMLAGSLSIFNLPFAIGINTTSISGIEIRTVPGEAVSTFNAHFFSASVSTSHNLYENLYGGATIKYIYENLFTDDATGIAFDFGLTYADLIDGLSIGTSFRNIGSMKALRNESTVLPKDFRLGASYSFKLPQMKLGLTALGGFQKYTDTDESHIHAGGEVNYDNSFSIRLGYLSGDDSKNITTGFGLHWKGLNLDYAYVPVKYGLGDSHIISFIYSFD